MKEARRTKTLMVNGIDYVENIRMLTRLKEEVRERESEKSAIN